MAYGHLCFGFRLDEFDDILDAYENGINLLTASVAQGEPSAMLRLQLNREIAKHWIRHHALRTKWQNYRRTFSVENDIRSEATAEDLEQKLKPLREVIRVDEHAYSFVPIEKSDDPYAGTAKRKKKGKDEKDSRRKKRFAGLLFFGFLAAGTLLASSLGIFSAVELSTISKAQVDTNDLIVSHVATNQKVLSQHELRIDALNATTTDLMQTTNWIVKRQKVNALESQLGLMGDLVEMHLHSITSSLDALLHRQLTPSLVNATTMTEALEQLERKASNYDFSLPSEHLPLYYELPASWLITGKDNAYLFVFVHVPMAKRATVLQLYQHVSMPIPLAKSPHNVRVEAEEDTLIAVTDDRTGYVTMSELELQACKPLGQILICPAVTYLLRNFKTNCLAALFTSQNEAIESYCRTTVVSDAFLVTQDKHNLWSVFHPYPEKVTLECGGILAGQLEFRGARQILLEPGCRAHNEHYAFEAYPAFALNYTVRHVSQVWRVQSILHNISIEHIEIVLPTLPKKAIALAAIEADYQLLRHQPKWGGIPLHYQLFGLNTVMLVLVIALVLACAWIFRKRLKAVVKRTVSRAGSVDSASSRSHRYDKVQADRRRGSRQSVRIADGSSDSDLAEEMVTEGEPLSNRKREAVLNSVRRTRRHGDIYDEGRDSPGRRQQRLRRTDSMSQISGRRTD